MEEKSQQVLENESLSFGSVDKKPLDLNQVWMEIGSSSKKRRGELFREMKVLYDDKSVELFTAIIFSTLFRYHDRTSIRIVEEVIQDCSQKQPFLEEFLKQFMRTSNAISKFSSTQTIIYFKMLRWSCCVLQGFPAWEELKKKQPTLLSSLISQQIYLMFRLNSLNHRAWLSAISFFKQTLVKHPFLFGEYITMLGNMEIDLKHCTIIGALFEYSSQTPKLIEQYKSKFVEWFKKSIFMSSAKPAERDLDCFKALIHSISHEEFEKTLMPAFCRMLKRSPELVLNSVYYLFHHIKIDLGNYVINEILPNLLPHLKSNSEEIRQIAILAMEQVAIQTSDVHVIEEFLTKVLNYLKSKPPSWFERASGCNALKKICKSQKTRDKQQQNQLAQVAATGIAEFLETEVNDDAHIAGLSALGCWLSCADSVPDRAKKLFSTNIKKDKETIRHATLQSLISSIENIDSQCPKSNQIVELFPELLKIIKKPNVHPFDGVLVLRIITKIAAFDSSADEKCKSEKLWALFSPDSFLFKPTNFAKMKEVDLSELAALLEIVLIHHFSKIREEHQNDLFTTIISLLTHSSLLVRNSAISSVRNAMKFNDQVSNHCVQAFWKILQTPNSLNPAFASEALVAVVSSSLESSLFPILFLCAHHPNVKVDDKVWKRALNKTHIEKTPKHILEEYWEPTSGFLLSDQCINRKDLHELRIASIGALSTLGSQVSFSLSKIVPELCTLIRNSPVLNLSENQIGIYFTPPGELFEKETTDEYVPQVVETKTTLKQKKKRGERRMYDEDDIEWEEKLRKELEKKKKEKQPEESPEEKKRKEKLQQEQKIRDEVSELVVQHAVYLQTFDAIGSKSSSVLLPYFPSIIPTLTPQLRNEIIVDDVSKTIISLSKCLHPKLKSYSFRIGHAVVHTCKEDHLLEEFIPAMLDDIVTYVSGVCDVPLPISSFCYVYPILKTCLLHAFDFTSQENAMRLIELHLDQIELDPNIHHLSEFPGPYYPRSDCIQLLIALMNNSPRFNERAKECTLNICQNMHFMEGTEERELLELLKGLHSSSAFTRFACLCGLENVPALVQSQLPQVDKVAAFLWFPCQDINPDNAKLASKIWSLYANPLPRDYFEHFVSPLSREEKEVQVIASKSIAAAVKEYPDSLEDTISKLVALYITHLPEPDAKEDEHIQIRCGVGLTLGACASLLDSEALQSIFQFLIEKALMDSSDKVRQQMIQAGTDIINEQGHSHSSSLLPIFENFLNETPKETDESAFAKDRVRESVVIFMGNLAKHLDPENPKIKSIVNMIIEMLKTPSETVQKAVSKCLIPLMTLPSVQRDAEKLVNLLLEKLKAGGSYGERRGAAYGLAGCVKGLGISSLKKFGIMTSLQSAVEDKKHANSRQGALFAFECLCTTLERLFEPYVIQILPKLLICFGDSVADVREATIDTARAIMGQLSAHGVKLVLPALLKALDDRNWRTKRGSCELLGSMAFCSPRQLSSCLPTIVPRLAVVLNDTHSKVQEGAREALRHIGSVIRNPEIQVHVPILLKAMDDPDEHSKEALDNLIHTNFIHAIDAPSLSLIIPILSRGLRDRNMETKKKAAQIVGNMCSLTEHKDLLPYLDVLLPRLKEVVIDPIPEVRAIGSKALGSLIKGMGEEHFSDLVPWCMETMQSDAGAVERSGAAQALSEVLAGLDVSRLENLLPEIISNCNHSRAYVREGFLGVFIFLPGTMTKGFLKYLSEVLPSILKGLSDEVETVREIALRAASAIVNQYAHSALGLLLPTLEDGLFDDNWRIRASTVQLLGDFLHKIISSHSGEGEDEIQIMSNTLGEERRNRILSALYLTRNDISPVVQQKALQVWKIVVTNTPKTLKEILSVLMSIIIDFLGSDILDKRHVSGVTLGDLVEKMGDKIFAEIVSILENGLDSDNPATRQGVCVGISEVMNSCHKTLIHSYSDVLIPSIKKALCDTLSDVREAAAQAFDILVKIMGTTALDEIITPLLAEIEQEDSHAMEALKQILTVRSGVVLPYLVPKLLSPPISVFNANALASVAEVAGPSLNQHISDLIPALIEGVSQNEEIKEAAKTIILAVREDGLYILVSELVRQFENVNPKVRVHAADLIGHYCQSTNVDIEEEAEKILQSLLHGFNDPVEDVQKAMWKAMSCVTPKIKKESAANYVQALNDTLQEMKNDLERQVEEYVPVFCMPKGIAPILPIFLNGFLYGSIENRQQAATGLGDIIKLTPDKTLGPHVSQIAGPLLKIMSDKIAPEIKVAILDTLNVLISKGGSVATMLKPFLPPFQRTFVKSLQDPNRQVRSSASVALGSIMTLFTKVDPLITQLLGGISSSEGDVQETMLSALRLVILNAGKTISPPVLEKIASSLLDLLGDDEESTRVKAALCIGAYSKYCPSETLDSLLQDTLLVESPAWQSRHGNAAALWSILQNNESVFSRHQQQIVSLIRDYIRDDKVPVRRGSCKIIGQIMLLPDFAESSLHKELVPMAAGLLSDSAIDTKLTAIKVIKKFAKENPELTRDYLSILVPPLLARAKERGSAPVKLAAERALMHTIQIHYDSDVLPQYCSTLDANSSKSLMEYANRVLSKLKPESDEEE